MWLPCFSSEISKDTTFSVWSPGTWMAGQQAGDPTVMMLGYDHAAGLPTSSGLREGKHLKCSIFTPSKNFLETETVNWLSTTNQPYIQNGSLIHQGWLNARIQYKRVNGIFNVSTWRWNVYYVIGQYTSYESSNCTDFHVEKIRQLVHCQQ